MIPTNAISPLTDTVVSVFNWLLGGFTTASWTDVAVAAPYVGVSSVALLLHRRVLDVLSVGDDEAASLGVNVGRVRLVAGTSYRIVLPLSLLFGAAFLTLCDLLARTVSSPAELPIGVITAFFGAPFFVILLRTSKIAR